MMVFSLWIYCALARLTPFIILSYLSLQPLLFNDFQCALVTCLKFEICLKSNKINL
jgi:hypothetical protein